MARAVASHNHRLLAAGLAAAAALAGCSSSDPSTCDDHGDCASGFCRADHTCAPVDDVDAAPTSDGTPPPDGPPVNGCVPNHDGTITRDELVMAAGQTATFRVATNVTTDTAGAQGAGGARTWDYTAALSGDADLHVMLLAPAGQWWAGTFPTASYATRLSAASDLLGVMRLDANGLELLGVVSPAGGITRTELTYDPPVPIIPTPLGPSSSWTTNTTITGLANGIFTPYTERYQGRVDAIGTLVAPYGSFPVRRIAVDLTRTVGAAITTKRTFAFVSECYGTVATITSQDYEQGAEFTRAAELWRLTP
ncbi:MAG TPA: hypothetical protein VHE35_24150 [Kofleriaceae bacterium]|nr:hypothetical protein [Kofleriaceae bacterium]